MNIMNACSASVALFVLASVDAQAAIRVTGCAPSYGPQETNLVVLLDDDIPLPPSQGRVVRIGYEWHELFSEFRIQGGCRKLELTSSFLTCDGKRIGKAGPVRSEIADPGNNGYRASVLLHPAAFDLTGSCNDKRNPLTILFRPGNL